MSEPSLPTFDAERVAATRERARGVLASYAAAELRLEPRFLVQPVHLTTPATVWKYVEGACTRSAASLVMLDLEDSIPRGDDEALRRGRENVVRAFRELDWGRRLRFFRPRGLELDPGCEDLETVVAGAGARVEGVVLPKVEGADEVRLVDEVLTELELCHRLAPGSIRLEVLIESANAVEQAFAIARASRRLVGLVFGAFDYWSSLGMLGVPYRRDHALVDYARARIVSAAASVGVPALAEMTIDFPTKDKTEAERQAALEACRLDALHARELGFRGKWVGIPAQAEIAREVFALPDEVVERAVREARAFLAAERAGRGATMIGGKMADRATDRVNRVALRTAYVMGKLDEATAAELGIA
jgi:citrate lyase subunit beta/citryl-CoA lyase